MAHNKQKWRFAGNIEKSQKVKINFLKFFSSKTIFLSTYEASIHSIQTSNEKVMDNLSFSAI